MERADLLERRSKDSTLSALPMSALLKVKRYRLATLKVAAVRLRSARRLSRRGQRVCDRREVIDLSVGGAVCNRTGGRLLFCIPYERRLSLRPVWLTVGRT
jgi:hypothetical protein